MYITNTLRINVLVIRVGRGNKEEKVKLIKIPVKNVSVMID